ncbi:MAG: nucleotidyltransferase domain-containing protein [Candidatus Aenigmarchaeota archaeon]|nr:nucleotidyltransferase domain-containing protein [Candidatus Aenigmarchaeota archaeon]
MERKKYAIIAAAFIMNRLPSRQFKKLRNVILFGSVAMDTGSDESDIDLFFDLDATQRETASVKDVLEKAADEFCLSAEALKFKMAGIDNPVSVHAGRLEEWENLKPSIESTGILLYGKYVPEGRSQKRYAIFYWDRLKTPLRGAFLNKVYGYTAGGRHYSGFAERLGGMRIGKSAVMVPLRRKTEFVSLLEKYGIDYRTVEV